MKIKSLALAAVIATAMSAPTMAVDWFIGGGVGAQQNTYKGSYQGVDPEFNGDYASARETENNEFYEFRVGTYLNDSSRVYGTYSYNSDDASRQQSLMVSYDYLVGLGASNKLNWFIGATAGVNHISPDVDEVSSKDRFVWGGQTGLMYKINDKLSTELGYRYLKQDYKVSGSYADGSGSIKLQDSQQLYLAVDYRF
ncbi:conserved exported protein of unknown function [Shewanella benthica]|uniref:Outer membrane protein beta-barrel domain-containing protein n=1 Tax=Shewanella benthica TaxID=43661 RepID=A0A330LX13_9GAMM|nr:outer membrane beta-barrel protein [Shewanella benthica]SQH74128.1 conserved exported protein of unknown function [Shewanella benthica]